MVCQVIVQLILADWLIDLLLDVRTYLWTDELTNDALICLYNHSLWLIPYTGIRKMPDWWDTPYVFVVFSYVGTIYDDQSPFFGMGFLRIDFSSVGVKFVIRDW